MDFTAIASLICNVGFPIACCIFLFNQNSKFQETLISFGNTLKDISDQMKELNNRIDNIDKNK